MAGDAVVGALRVVLGMDTASYEDGAKKAGKATQDFVKDITKIATGIQLQQVFDRLVDAFFSNAKAAIELGDTLNKMSQRVGTSVETLSSLKLAADISGVGLSGLGDAMDTLGKKAIEAVNKPLSQAGIAFRALGVSLTDANGKIKSNKDLLLDVADASARFKDGVTKSAAVTGVLGGAAEKLIPTLNKGSAGLKELMKEAEQLGIVIDSRTAAAATRFNENLIKLGAAKDSLFIKISAQLLPSLERLTGLFVQAAKDGSTVDDGVKKIGESATASSKRIEEFANAFTVLKGAKDVIKSGFSTAEFDKFVETFAKAIEKNKEIQESYSELGRFVSTVFRDLDATAAAAAKRQEEMNAKALAGKNAFDLYIESTNRASEATKVEAASKQLAIGKTEALKVVTEGFLLAKDKQLVLGEKEHAQLLATAELRRQATIDLAAETLVIQNLDPYEQYLRKQQQINELVRERPKIAQAAEAEMRKQAGQTVAAYGQAASTIVGGFADAFKVIAEKNKQWAKAAKALAISTAIVNTLVAATKAYAEVPYPLNFAAAAAVTAAGFANVAKISATEFAQGGSFKVGGAGGIDSQLVQFKATPGEMVDVRKPGQTGPAAEITVRGMSSREFFSGEMVRDMIHGLNQAYSDGYKLKFAS